MSSYKRFTLSAALMALAGASVPADAYQPLVTDDTGTQGHAGNQLEFALIEDRAESAGAVERVHARALVYSRGLSETVDVFAGLIYSQLRSDIPGRDASGGSDPLFGVKWRFYAHEPSKTSFAIKPVIVQPVGSDRDNAALGNGKTSGNLTFILTHEVAFGAIHFNAGVFRNRYRDTLNNPDATTTRVSIAPAWHLGAHWKLAADLGTESERASGSSVRARFAQLGAVYSPNTNLDWSLGILSSSKNDNPRTTRTIASAGLTWRFR
jgi:hypothetical protein